MLGKFKLTDVLYFILAAIGVALELNLTTALDIVFYTLLVCVIAIVLARVLHIESQITDLLFVVLRQILQMMAMTCVLQFIYRTDYLELLFCAVFIWGTITYAKWSSKNKRAEEAHREFTWRYNEYKRTADQQKTADNRQDTNNRHTTGHTHKKLTPYQKSKFYQECTNEEELKDKYRELVKKYHPDSTSGNEELFIQVNNEYEELLKYVEKNKG